MRKLWIALLAVSFTVSGFAQVGVWIPESFRLQGTYVISDDFDKVIDPIDIGKIDGNRLYTNLSNLLSYNEEILGTVWVDQYLLGYSGSLVPMLPALKTSILIEKERVDVSSYLESTDWDYTDRDYLYTFGSQESKTQDDARIFLLNNFYDLGTLKIGGRLTYRNSSYSQTTANRGFEYNGINAGDWSFESVKKEYKDTLVLGNDTLVHVITDTTYENGVFSTKSGPSIWELDFSGAYPMGDLELRGNLGFFMFSDKETIEDEATYFRDNHPHTDSLVDETTWTESVKGTEKVSYMGIDLSGRVRQYTDGEGYLEAKAGFGMLFAGKIDYNVRDEFDKKKKQDAGKDLAFLTEGTTDNYKDSIATGDISGLSFSTGAKAVIQLDENLLFGIGANIEFFNDKVTVTDKPEEHKKFVSLDHDTIDNDPNDYTETRDITGEEIKNEFKFSEWTYEFPVGLEYKFGKKKDFRFRIGALVTCTDWTNKTTTTSESRYIEIYNKDYVDPGLDDIADTTEQEDYTEKSVTKTHTFTQTTEYTYGLGWYPTENLQIDLLGFLDLDDEIWVPEIWKNLRLSVTLKFF